MDIFSALLPMSPVITDLEHSTFLIKTSIPPLLVRMVLCSLLASPPYTISSPAGSPWLRTLTHGSLESACLLYHLAEYGWQLIELARIDTAWLLYHLLPFGPITSDFLTISQCCRSPDPIRNFRISSFAGISSNIATWLYFSFSHFRENGEDLSVGSPYSSFPTRRSFAGCQFEPCGTCRTSFQVGDDSRKGV